MSDIPLGPYTVGIDHVSKETSLPDGAVTDAINVNFEDDGRAARRPGATATDVTSEAHSLWVSNTLGIKLVVHGDDLNSLTIDGDEAALSQIYTLIADMPLSYCELNDKVIAANTAELLEIDASYNVRPLAIETPPSPAVAVNAAGGLYAGTYAVACAFMRGDEEGALSSATFVELSVGQGLSVTVPQPADADVTFVRVYRTEANGTELRRAADVPVGMLTYILGTSELGRATDTQHLTPMPGGQIVRYFRGHLLVARGRVLRWSEPQRYGLTNMRFNFIQGPHTITLCEPVENGVFIGDRAGVRFLSGQTPKEWSSRLTGGAPPVPYTGLTVDASDLGGDISASGDKVAMWLAKNGFVIGTADGRLVEPQAKRIRLPNDTAAVVGSAVVHDGQIIASIN